MSYSQIFRRLNRILKTTVNDVIDTFTKDEEELNDFDEELRNPQGKHASDGQQQRQSGTGSTGGSRSRSGRESGSQHKEGKHKPGERDDSFYYSVLGLTPNATHAEIKKAYRNLMRQYHPDKVASLGADLQAAASKKAKEINEAYHIIERRRGYK
jgi:DnaJ like chaperone protein